MSILPPDLLILNRYGIGYPYLQTAHKLSLKYQVPAFEVLIKAGVITEKTWLSAQSELHQERVRVKKKREQEAYLLDQSINNLSDNLPHYSAKKTFTKSQCFLITLAILSMAWLTYTNWNTSLLVFFIPLTLFYTAGILLRGLLLAHFEPAKSASQEVLSMQDSSLPVYSILVALYQEASQVEQLTKRLWALDWPKDKLDIQLICEADDLDTIKAIVKLKLPPCFKLVMVPPSLPRTKPKALNYALPLSRGDYLVLYDAEDLPSSGQLKEAYAKFSSEAANYACLQAPLHIHNHKQNWLSTMFAIEYVTLFTGILPVLAKWQVPIPLGGTSNHFKTNILKKSGGWDPYNVTEDADLGIRLFREGYLCGTLTLPTYEEAPPKFLPWLKQRTRWIKGWMQTILVHSRNPLHFVSDIGIKNTIAFHLLMTSIVISALIHPIFLGYSIWYISQLASYSPTQTDIILIIASVFNLVGGYTTYGLLAYAVLKTSSYKPFSGLLITLPFYWLMISLAGWRALVHLFVKPHLWEKTPHGLAK